MDKYQEILSEIDKDGNDEEMVVVLNKLSKYNVPKPTAAMTSSLLYNLKAVLQENDSNDGVPILKPINRVAIERSASDGSLLSVLRLVKPQLAILSWRFMAVTSLIIFAGIFLTNGDRDSLIFLTNGAPILGLLTLFYEHRAELYGTNELEASCPYTPAQLAGARIIVTLGYTIIVCLTATGMIALSFSDMLTNEKVLLWKTILAWLAPMVFFLGVALAVSLRLGAMYGCGTAFIMWVAKVIFEQSDVGRSLIQISLVGNGLIQRMPMILLVIGLILIAIYLRCMRVENMDYSQEG
ncbi:hypothetical protein [Pelosinus fermentans]|uniref:ABC-2 membrane transporter-like n=1 Tax=Pelosinus fermentans JBW45 TaxID=1192197 RepID=I9DC38_9FIRM|nr:hypothetical protein [Pelosinus fermentans]AJQ28754.1 ABC-2 membrane transporter-like [Pelosinus fermentans JBW45]